MALKSRVFRLFVSSTFSDFIEEREALQKYVFPKLEDYCAERGTRFQAVDLRWGITEQAQRDRETLQICLEEVRRGQELSPRPNFAILLGHRYGWEPLPECISEDHWERLVKRLEELGAGKDKKALEKVYRADTNAVPTTYYLKPSDLDIDEVDIQAILRRAAANFVGSDRLPYFGSATHQEIAVGALGVEDASEHVHAYIRRIKNPPTDASATDFIDVDDSARQRLDDLENELRDRLAENHVHEFDCAWNGTTVTKDHLKSFCDEFYQHQVALIGQELDRIKQNEAEQTTNSVHHAFAKEQTEIFVGRESLLDQISEYLRSPATLRSPLIATAEGGAGKTSIMARSYLQAAATGPSPSISPVILCRFIGGVAGMESLKSLLESLISDINAVYDAPDTNTNRGVNEASKAFKAALDHATAEKPLWVFIDALDQLEKIDNLPLSDWLPETLPAAVRLVLSARRETLPAAVLDNPNLNVIEIDGMALDEGDTLLSRWLASSRHPLISTGASLSHGRTLTSKQRNLILGRFKKNPNPLWLKLAYEEARRWHSWDHPKPLAGTVTEMVERFIGNYLIDKRKHPPIFTRKALSYIAAGRYGLSEEEIAKALGTDPEVRKEFEDFEKPPTKWESEDQLPPILWSRLFLDLRPYLTSAFTDGTVVFRYFHREFRETIERLYFEGEQKALLHTHLAEVFSKPNATDLYRQTDASGQNQDSRAMRRIMEQPWQLARAGQGQRLRNLLMNFSFCMAKCAANRSEDLVQDYIRSLAIEKTNDNEWLLWSRFIIGRNSTHLAEADQDWPAHRIFLQFALEHALGSPLTLEAKNWAKKQTLEWECHYLKSPHQQISIDNCVGVLQQGPHSKLRGATTVSDGRILSWSTDGTLSLWSANTGQRLSVLFGHTDVVNDLIVLSDGNLLSCSSDNTLRLWSREGEYITVFEGHDRPVIGAQELSNGDLVSWSYDNTLRLWSKDGMSIAIFRGHLAAVRAVKELSNRRLISWSEDGTLRLWTPTGKALAVMDRHYIGAIMGCHELEDGRLVSWSDNGALKLWSEAGIFISELSSPAEYGGATSLANGGLLSWSDDTCKLWSATADCIALFEGHSDNIRGAKELRSGMILSWSSDDTARIWAPTGDCLAVLQADSPVMGAHELADGKLVTWAGLGELDLWSPCGDHLASMEGHLEIINDVLELKDGNLLSHSWDGILRLWSANGKALALLEGHEGKIGGVRELAHGRLLSWSKDGSMRLWAPIATEKIEFDAHSGTWCNANELRDGRLLSYSDDGLRLWSPDLELITTFGTRTQSGPRYHGALELMDGRLLSWDSEGTLQLWSSKGEPLRDLQTYGLVLEGAQELSDGRIISWSENGLISLWSRTGEHLSTFGEGSNKYISAQELAEDRLAPLYSVHEGSCGWDSDEGEIIAVGISHSDSVQGIKELQDGRLLSWSFDHTLRLWSPTGTPLALLQGHSEPIVEARELEDGRLESWSRSNKRLIWSSSGKPLDPENERNSSTSPEQVTQDQNTTSDNTLVIWNHQKQIKERDVKVSNQLHCLVKTRKGDVIAFVGFSKIYPTLLKKLETD